MKFLEDLASRRRFGMKPGLDGIRMLCAAIGDPQLSFRSIHVAGTNGKGAVCAILDAVLREMGFHIGRYTSPHLVRLNERFFLDGRPLGDDALEESAKRVMRASSQTQTFFEALTATAFDLYARHKVDYAILECGLGGRLDATNVCEPALCVITRVGLDHCDWLGDTIGKIAAEKAGIVKAGIPIVLGRNSSEVVEVVRRRSEELRAPFHYAPDLADESEIPTGFPLLGAFNRENAVTALAALRVLLPDCRDLECGFGRGVSHVVWPGRFHRIGRFIVDGAHNPPAAKALADSLTDLKREVRSRSVNLIFGACGDKDVSEVLSILSPIVKRGFAVRTNNPRSLSAADCAAKMRAAGIDATPCTTLHEAIERASPDPAPGSETLICGSLFLAGEALVELGAYPWGTVRFDAEEQPLPTEV